MNNKIFLMLLLTMFFIGIVQAQVFSTPGAVQECPTCPAPIACDNSTQVQTQIQDQPQNYISWIISFFAGFLVCLMLVLFVVKNPFRKGDAPRKKGGLFKRKKKQKSILDLTDNETRENLFQEISMEVEEEKQELNKSSKLYNELSPKERKDSDKDDSEWTKFRY